MLCCEALFVFAQVPSLPKGSSDDDDKFHRTPLGQSCCVDRIEARKTGRRRIKKERKKAAG